MVIPSRGAALKPRQAVLRASLFLALVTTPTGIAATLLWSKTTAMWILVTQAAFVGVWMAYAMFPRDPSDEVPDGENLRDR